ncbi:MAG: hypothetical protein QOF51_1690 [Chloroflexota bacterium]|jgi:hypothetical protein|nr:hypothetical protein [Chloroflexota bacterium]
MGREVVAARRSPMPPVCPLHAYAEVSSWVVMPRRGATAASNLFPKQLASEGLVALS